MIATCDVLFTLGCDTSKWKGYRCEVSVNADAAKDADATDNEDDDNDETADDDDETSTDDDDDDEGAAADAGASGQVSDQLLDVPDVNSH